MKCNIVRGLCCSGTDQQRPLLQNKNKERLSSDSGSLFFSFKKYKMSQKDENGEMVTWPLCFGRSFSSVKIIS